jgi:hypothetical protein
LRIPESPKIQPNPASVKRTEAFDNTNKLEIEATGLDNITFRISENLGHNEAFGVTEANKQLFSHLDAILTETYYLHVNNEQQYRKRFPMLSSTGNTL